MFLQGAVLAASGVVTAGALVVAAHGGARPPAGQLVRTFRPFAAGVSGGGNPEVSSGAFTTASTPPYQGFAVLVVPLSSTPQTFFAWMTYHNAPADTYTLSAMTFDTGAGPVNISATSKPFNVPRSVTPCMVYGPDPAVNVPRYDPDDVLAYGSLPQSTGPFTLTQTGDVQVQLPITYSGGWLPASFTVTFALRLQGQSNTYSASGQLLISPQKA